MTDAPKPVQQSRVVLLGNPNKKAAQRAFTELKDFAQPRCNLVEAVLDIDAARDLAPNADRIIVLGGDGTLIGVARALGDHQVPLIGVNVGKLGFLAEFSLEEFKSGFERALSDESLISGRAVLQVSLSTNGQKTDAGLAINDCVIQAGPPYRMINLGVSINGDHLTEVAGDGLIVCTPGGSTAHNLSAGGPIVQPGVASLIITPLAPHSLTHRPLAIEGDSVIDIRAVTVNEGTTVIIDGQTSYPMAPADRVTIRRSDNDLLLVRNPLYPPWHKLRSKLRWGEGLTYG